MRCYGKSRPLAEIDCVRTWLGSRHRRSQQPFPLWADTVAKVVLHRWSKFLQAGGVVFVQGPEGPRRFTLKSSATLVARLRLHESSISARFKFSPKIQTSANFDFCNSIGTFRTCPAKLTMSVEGANRTLRMS
jgi:hypothetical protein